VQVILPPEVSARNFGEAALGNLKFVIGQKNGAQWTLTMGVHYAPFTQKWICRMVMWILQNGHVDFA
jgi:hypothetical protein